MVWGAIWYHERTNLLRFESNNTKRYVCKVLQPEAVFLFSFSRIMFAQMSQRLFEISVQKNTCNFSLGLLIRRIYHLLSTYGIWLVDVFLAIRIFKSELWLLIQAVRHYLTKADFRNLFHSVPRRIAALIAVRGG